MSSMNSKHYLIGKTARYDFRLAYGGEEESSEKE